MTRPVVLGHRLPVTASDPADAFQRRTDEPAVARQPVQRRSRVTLAALALVVAGVAQRVVGAILHRVGHPGATLDDAYIHFQYARAIAEGHPFRFTPGAPMTSGATSLLWPFLLAPFWLLGARDEAIVWAAWVMSFAALGGLTWEAASLTQRLAGRTAAIGAGAMTLAFGGFLWCAASGMEVVPFAWAIARASRRACEWAEAPVSVRTRSFGAELAGMAWIAALLRPEGAVTAAFVTATLAAFPGGSRRARAFALGSACAVVSGPVLLWMITGSARSTTTIAKLLPGNPYYAGSALWDAVSGRAKILADTLLNGEAWSAEFLPHRGAAVAVAGLCAVAFLGRRAHARWRASAVLLLALTAFAPCFYLTFLCNRLRYLWPFATGWIIGLACLSRLLGDAAGRFFCPRWRRVTGVACGAFAGLFASKFEWVVDDIAQSASGVDRQQVALGRWAKEHLSKGARIGVNDTGAIAYFSELPTFDIVGLTTKEEARYWVAGAGSRFEHYERLAVSAPLQLPTHFIVYREWMAIDALLGQRLHELTVSDATVLGGPTMGVYVADWSKLGSGEQPWTAAARGATVVDALDVADLESESLHGYELLGAHDTEETVHEGRSRESAGVVDGGRTRRWVERFVARLPPRKTGVRVHGVVRIQGSPGTVVSVFAGGQRAARFELDDSNDGQSEDAQNDWTEQSFPLASASGAPETRIELRVTGEPVTLFHYWFIEEPASVD